MKYFPTAAATLLHPGVTNKNEQIRQIRVNFYLFKTSNVNSFGILDSFSTYPSSLSKHLSHLVNARYKKEVGCCASHWRTAHCSSISSISETNFRPPSIFSSGPKNNSQWVLNPDCMVDVVTPLTPGCPQSPQRCAAPYGKIQAAMLPY